MKIVVLVGAGRSGVDLLQSLFDEHPEICQFPGYFGFQQFWQKAKKEKNLETLAKYFITDHPHFFDSRLNLIERHHMLGKDKNSFFLVFVAGPGSRWLFQFQTKNQAEKKLRKNL